MKFNPDPHTPLLAGTEIILIGSVLDEGRFLETYGNHMDEIENGRSAAVNLLRKMFRLG